MRAKLIAVTASVAVLALAGVTAAFVTGFGPAPGGDGGAGSGAFPTETPSSKDVSDGSVSGDATMTATDAPPFAFAIDRIEQCGRTCRDVTSTLTNRQDETAENVTVYTRVYAGNDTEGDVLWRGSEAVGTLGPGESYTATKRVELSYSEAYAVEQHGGWVTVQTTVETADLTVTFTEQRRVA